jgi:predicted nucleic-acid-binding Zn-ribbon protein
MKARFNAYDKKLNDFYDKILIACKSCMNKAIAIKKDNLIKVTCIDCGYNKTHNHTMPNEDYWLSIELSHGLFWAYNYEHLEFLRQHISAELRERSLDDIKNHSIGSRLPKWISSKKNREEILKVIEKLKAK